MQLDLTLLLSDWKPARDAVAARRFVAEDGEEFVQLRVDLGVLQMAASGRPDGARHRGMPSVLDFIRHELRLGRRIAELDWAELERELHQFNYRRIAYGGLTDEALLQNDLVAALELIRRTVRDVEHCLEALRVLESEGGRSPQPGEQIPVLVFHRSRLLVRALALEDRFEEAIDAAEEGVVALDETLARLGFDEGQRERDPGIAYLRQTAQRLRQQHGIGQTLSERLADAVAREDFVTAAQIRDELRRRDRQPRTP